MNSISYRRWAYLSTILTGFAALCAQVIWQRYLAILVGSEARSLTLVVAVFLAGLAAGYYVFGLITERKQWSRRLLLKFYGYTELITAFYIGFFCVYFNFLKTISFHSPSYFIIDILISFLALLLPTFLMGASIPILTATLPDNSQEINTIHAKVYGWNTLGACLGTLVSGFYLLPVFGLDHSLILAGIINLFASLVFIKNPLKGDVHKQEQLPVIPSALSNRFYLIFTFLTGAIIISFEVFFVRILHLSTDGARVYNFPLILAIFIGGLALGSLSISKHKISVRHLIQQLLNTICLLGFLFWVMPYWPIWFSNIRSSLGFMSSDYIVFQIFIFVFLVIFLFPAVFCMGQLLPLVYALLKKNKKNYGRVCGYLYFCNTLGTAVGAIGIGYLSLYIFNIDHLFKINIYMLIFLAFIIAFFEKKKGYITALTCFGLVFVFLPIGWNRTEYYPSYIHKNKSHVPTYKEWFFLPRSEVKDEELVYFKDGPNTTVLVHKHFRIKETDLELDFNPVLPFYRKKYFSYSLKTNGKGDGSIIGEFSTFFLVSGLAYLFAPSQSESLSAAVVGLGTGISTAVFSQLEAIKEVKVLEISPKVIKGISLAPSHLNFEIFHNKKVNIIEIDAFKYFTKTRKKFDIIISQPSNLWVVGVENLFSQDFYQLARKSLSQDGILGQWLQNYGIDEHTLKMILRTLKSVFPYTELYKIGPKDMLILASQKPLDHNVSDKRFFNPFLNAIFKSFGIYDKKDISLTRIFSSSQYEQIMSFNSKDGDIHSLTKPKLSYLVDKTFFLTQDSDPFDIMPAFIKEDRGSERREKIKSFHRYKKYSPDMWKERCPDLISFHFLCVYMHQALEAYQAFIDTSDNYPAKLNRYSFLRRHGLIDHDKEFLNDIFSGIMKKRYLHENTPLVYVNERMSQEDHETAYKHMALLKEEKIINEEKYQTLKAHIDKYH